MTKQMEQWLVRQGFTKTETRPGSGHFAWDCGSLRVACFGFGDVFSVIQFAGRSGWSAVKWQVEFPCPEGRLSPPEAVVCATILAALKG